MIPRREFTITTFEPERYTTDAGNVYMRPARNRVEPITVQMEDNWPFYEPRAARICYTTPSCELSVLVDGPREAQRIVQGLIAVFGYQAIYGPDREEESW